MRNRVLVWCARLLVPPVAALALVAQTTPAAACRAVNPNTGLSQRFSPNQGVTFTIGAGTQTESPYRGVHGAIAIASNTPDPDPNQLTDRHIAVSINEGQKDPQNPTTGRPLLSNIGWQMGMLQQLPSGTKIWSHSATIFFEGLDKVSDYRATYGAAQTQGNYEDSWAGTSPTGRYEYMGWYQLGTTWYQAGYAEFELQYGDANSEAEATDASAQGSLDTACLQLSSGTSNLHEHGSPSALLVLTDTWHDWTSSYPVDFGLDNNAPYTYSNVSAPNFDHDRVGGP